MKTSLSTHVFNFRLFVEGLKRLKVMTVAVGVLSVVISALMPIIQWINFAERIEYISAEDLYWAQKVEDVEASALVLPIYGVVFLAPFFIFILFSFLHKRRECDFFHAMPYTRICAYVSFVCAALVSVFGIMSVSTLVAGVLWTVNPYAVFSVSDLILQLLVCVLSAAMLSSIMMLTLTLTGTGGSTLLLFCLFTLLPRYVLYLLSENLNFHVIVPSRIPFLSLNWFLPFGMLTALDSYGRTYAENFSASQIIYSVIVTLGLFILAGFFYKIRKSEMAGNTAPNRITQHIFRCLFTLSVALLLPFFCLDGSDDFITCFVIVVVSLLVYYLYELMTTKRLKNLLTATPWLLGVATCLLLYAGVYHTVRGVVLYEDIEADEIASVTWTDYNEYYDGYQQLLMDQVKDPSCTDPEVISLAAENLKESKIATRTNTLDRYLVGSYWDDNWIELKIKLKDGRTMYRRVALRSDALAEFSYAYSNAIVENGDIWVLPPSNVSITAGIYQYKRYESVKIPHNRQNEFEQTLISEYNDLDIFDKVQARNRPQKSVYGAVHIEGRMSDQTFYSIKIYVTSDMPKTLALIEEFKALAESEKNEIEDEEVIYE